MPALLLVGRITAAHGLRGLVKLQCFTAQPDRSAATARSATQRGKRLFEVTVLNPVKGGVVASIAGVSDRNAAEKLRGVELYHAARRLAAAERGRVLPRRSGGIGGGAEGRHALWAVQAVENYGAGDLLAIVRPGGGRSACFTDRVVPVVDIAGGRVVVDPPLGLVDEVKKEAKKDG